MSETRIIVFAKAPVAGFAKTRLIPALGPEGAAALARRLLLHAVSEALAAKIGPVELRVTPEPNDPAWAGILPDASAVCWSDQGQGDLGERMARAVQRALVAGQPVMLIGSDCPALDRSQLRCAALELQSHDAVMTPALDGGYVLLGLRRFEAVLFHDIIWSTDSVSPTTVQRCTEAGLSLHQFPPLSDIDEPSDLAGIPPQLLDQSA